MNQRLDGRSLVIPLEEETDTEITPEVPTGIDDAIPSGEVLYGLDGLPDLGGWDMDPALESALIKTESSGNSNAVSDKNARGLMQVTDIAVRDLGLDPSKLDIFDPETNVKVGKAYYKKMLDQFGDEKLALAAYNGGLDRLQKTLARNKASTFEEVAADLPAETRDYVEKITKRKEVFQQNPTTQQVYAAAPEGAKAAEQYPATEAGFAQALIPIVSNPEFDRLSFNDKSAKIAELYNSQNWGPGAYDTVKQVVSEYWDAAPTEELPDLRQVIDPPPVLKNGDNADATLAEWKQQQVLNIYDSGVSPALLGNALDRYLDDSAAGEKKAFEARNRGIMSSIIGHGITAPVYNIAVGAVSGITKPVAGLVRLGGSVEGANAIESVTDFIPKPADDLIYQTDESGHLILNPDGTPVTRWSTDAAQIVGQVGTLMAGGAALKGVGYGARAINATLLGVNTLTVANDSFRTVYEETGGDVGKAYKASAFALPAAAIGSIGQTAVIAKWANPAIEGLSTFNKGTYLANVFARNAVVEGAANAGMDLTAQVGETLQTGQEISGKRLAQNAVAGGIVGGVTGAVLARGEKPATRLNDIPAPQDEAPAATPPLALPPGETRVGLPAPTERKLLPGNNNPLLSGPMYGPAENTVFAYAPVSAADQIEITRKLQQFQNSTAQTLTITSEQAKNIPPEMLTVLEMAPSTDGQTFAVTKRESHVQVEAQSLSEAEKAILSISKSLIDTPSPDNVHALIEERQTVKAEIARQTRSVERATTEALKQRTTLQKEVDSKKAQYEGEADRTLKGVLRLELQEAEANLTTFDEAHEDVYNLHQKVGELQDYLGTLNDAIKGVLDPLYVNNLKAKERNLQELLKTRQRYEQETRTRLANEQGKVAEQTLAQTTAAEVLSSELASRNQAYEQFSRGVEVSGNTIMPINDRWYVVDKNGDVMGGPHTFFYDAVTTAKNGVNRERGFQIKNLRDRTALTEEDVSVIRERVASERRIREETRELAEEHRNIVREAEIKEAKLKNAKEVRNRKNAQRKQGKVEEPASSVTALTEDGTIEYSTEAGAETVIPESPTYKPGVKAPPRTKPLNSRSEMRRVINPVQRGKVLTSNYTKLETFPENSSEVVRPKKLFQSAQNLAKALGRTKIFAGGSLPRSVLGFRDSVNNYVKVGGHNDIQTLIHELGHVVDAALIGRYDGAEPGMYPNVPKNIIAAAQDMADTFYPGAVPSDNVRTKEGLAMFLQHWMSGQPVRKDMQQWFETNFANENPGVFKALTDLKGQAYAYWNQTPSALKRSEIVPKKTFPQTFIEKVKNYTKLSNMKDNWVDRKAVFSDIDKATNGRGNLKDIVDLNHNLGTSIARSLVRDGVAQVKGKIYEVPAIKQILEGLKSGEDADTLEAYLTSLRDVAEMSQGKDSGSNIQDTQKFINQIQAERPEIVQAANLYYRLLDTVDQIESDMSPANAAVVAAMRKKNELATGKGHGFYIPFEREGKGGYDPTKTTKGSTRAKVDPLGNIEGALESRLERAFSGEIKRALVELAGSPIPSSLGAYVREIKNSDAGYKKVATEFEERVTKEAGGKPDRDDRHINAFYGDALDGISSTEYKVLPVFDGNKMRYFEVDPRVANTFSDSIPDWVNSPIGKMLRAGASVLRPMATTLNPAFQLRQLVKDPVDAWQFINTGNGGFSDAISLGRSVANQMLDVLIGGKFNQWAERTGAKWGSRGGAVEAERAALRKQFGKSFVDLTDMPFKALDRILSLPEQAVRQAVVEVTAKQLGIKDINQPLTPEQSMALVLAYKRGTTNFGQQGRTARVVNMGVPFFTARIAGLSRLPADVKRNPARMATLGGTLLGAGILHAIQHKDDEWYQELDPEKKMNAIRMTADVNGEQKMFYAPLSSFSSLFWGLGQAIGTKMGEDPELPIAYSELAKAYFSQNVTPINSGVDLMTPFVKEYVQQQANRDFYFDKPIVYPNLQFQDPQLQYTEYTTEFAKRIGTLTGWSPVRIDHAIRSVAPAVGNALSRTDKFLGFKEEDAGATNFMLSAFQESGSAEGVSSRSQAAFYDFLMAARGNKYAETPEEGFIRKQLERTNRNVSDINTMLRVPGITKEEKLELRQMRRDQLRNAIQIATKGEGLATKTGLEGIAKVTRKEQSEARGAEMRQRRATFADMLAGDSLESESSND